MRSRITVCHAAAAAPDDRESELRALMTMAAHDLKNPLASVTAHVAMLREDYGELGEDFRHDLAAIERGLHRLDRLTRELLDYARTDRELEPHPVPLDDLVGSIVEDHRTATTRISVSGALPAVVADVTLLRHVLDNLIGNAVKYTPAGAIPEIEIRARTSADGTTRIEVADRGIGIPDTDQPKLFGAFHRCANSTGYPGTGLGLNICRRIIERHGGRIGVESNPGGGSRFWFTLPAVPGHDDSGAVDVVVGDVLAVGPAHLEPETDGRGLLVLAQEPAHGGLGEPRVDPALQLAEVDAVAGVGAEDRPVVVLDRRAQR
jgi:signal transduction histidine kinase